MFGFIKKLFGASPVEKQAEAPYKVEAPAPVVEEVKPAPVVEEVKATPAAKPTTKKQGGNKKAAAPKKQGGNKPRKPRAPKQPKA